MTVYVTKRGKICKAVASILSINLDRLTVDLFRPTSYISYHPHRKERKTMFGNIGFPELLVIMIIALLIFGPKKLPEVGRSIGKALREFRKTSDEIKEKIEEEIQAAEFKDIKEELDKEVEKDEEGKKES
jgi:sec-independent protein translocase protein TatA